jgi:hypothetical protein
VEVHSQKSEWFDEHGAPATALLVPFWVTHAFPMSALRSWNQVVVAAARAAPVAVAAAAAEPTVSASPVPSSAAMRRLATPGRFRAAAADLGRADPSGLTMQ